MPGKVLNRLRLFSGKGGLMDKLDLGIIGILSKNSRTSFTDIGKKLKVSESTVRKRIEKLENTSTIKRYSLVVDTDKIGFRNIALIGVDASPEKYLDVAKKLAELSEIKYAASTTGDHMFMLKVVARDDAQLRDFSEKLKNIDGVTRICPAIIKDTLRGTL